MADCENSDGAKHNNFETHSLKLNKVANTQGLLCDFFRESNGYRRSSTKIKAPLFS